MRGKSWKATFDQASLEAAKWVALAAMTIDHYGKIVDPELFVATHSIGRLAYPLLAGILGLRLAVAPELAARYLRRLVPWALLSQPVFVVAGRQWHEGNILFTLVLGVLAWQGLAALAGEGARRAAWWLVVAVPVAFFTEFGPLGVFMPAAVVYAARAGATPALASFGPLGVLANVVVAAPFLTTIDLWALLATPVALVSPVISSRLPRLPTLAFYAYYPAHLYLLHRLDLWAS